MEVTSDTSDKPITILPVPTLTHPNEWPWVEVLLSSPIADYRKFAIWRILARYLINIKKLSYDEVFGQIRNWLNKCDRVRGADFNIDQRIKENLGAAIDVGYLPISTTNRRNNI